MPGTTFSPAGLLITITPTADLITAQGTIQAAMMAQINNGTSYVPQNGPSAGTTLNAAQWVYYWVSGDGTESDWAAVGGTSVPPFLSFSTAAAQSVMLPPLAQIMSGRIYFGMPSLPTIAVGSSVPQFPVSTASTNVYDFVEFSYVAGGATYADTTMIDQFGIPMQIELVPVSTSSAAPPPAGVFADRDTVISSFQANVMDAFLTGLQSICGPPLPAPQPRILSPNDVLVYNTVQGVNANVPAGGGSSTLAAGTYCYAVAAVSAQGEEGYVQPSLAQITIAADQQVTIGWSPLASQPYGGLGIASYNVYRFEVATGVWTLLNVTPPLDSNSTAAQDTGQSGIAQSPQFNPLATWFDDALESFFTWYQSNTLSLTVPNVGPDGSTWLYLFDGATVPASGSPQSLQFTLTAITDVNQNAIPADQWPFPAGTPFNIYYPFWTSNTYGTSSVPPPSWTPYPNSPASMMVFAANGVWADNMNQVYDNLPSQVTPPPPAPAGIPATSPAGIWNTILGTLENMVVSALTRGIAAPLEGALPVAPASWASQPTQTSPTWSPGTMGLGPGQTYYYVITAVSGTGSSATESAPSLEMSVPAVDTPPIVVNVNWNPVLPWQATSFNIYRGTVSGRENVLVENVPNDGTIATLADMGQGIAQSPSVSYFPEHSVYSDYVAFFHQTSISYGGGAYASPFDDQGNQSSTIVCNASALNITLGPWT